MAETDDSQQFTAEATIILEKDEQEELERLEERRNALLRKSGQAIINEDGSIEGEKEPWPHRTLDYMGDVWEYRVPKPLASMFLGTLSRKAAKPDAKLNAIMGYLEHVLSEDSLERLHERANDHDDAFDVREMSELVRLTATGGSSRPITSTSS